MSRTKIKNVRPENKKSENTSNLPEITEEQKREIHFIFEKFSDTKKRAVANHQMIGNKFVQEIATNIFKNTSPQNMQNAANYIDDIASQVCQAIGVKLPGVTVPMATYFLAAVMGAIIANGLKNPALELGKRVELTEEMFDEMALIFSVGVHLTTITALHNRIH